MIIRTKRFRLETLTCTGAYQDHCTLLIPITTAVYVSSGEHEIHEMWILLSIYNTGRVRYHGRRRPVFEEQFCHFREMYPVWGDRFLLESSHREKVTNCHVIVSRPIRSDHVTEWSVFSNLFYAFETLMPYPIKGVHDAVCHSLSLWGSLIFTFFFVLFRNTNGHIYIDDFLFEYEMRNINT